MSKVGMRHYVRVLDDLSYGGGPTVVQKGSVMIAEWDGDAEDTGWYILRNTDDSFTSLGTDGIWHEDFMEFLSPLEALAVGAE